MKLFDYCAAVLVPFAFVGCGEPERARSATITATAPRGGNEFDEIGKVMLYPGESCASQIMFVFRGARSTSVSVAAPFKQSRVLTDAAHDRNTVHVIGRWRRGNAPDCWYVEATQVAAVQKSFW